MTSNDWEKIQTAFQRALELSDGERDAYLTKFSREYPKLGEQVRNLVVADGSDDRQLRAPIANAIRRCQFEIAAMNVSSPMATASAQSQGIRPIPEP